MIICRISASSSVHLVDKEKCTYLHSKFVTGEQVAHRQTGDASHGRIAQMQNSKCFASRSHALPAALSTWKLIDLRVLSASHWIRPVAGMTGWRTKPRGIFKLLEFSAAPLPSQLGSNKRTRERKISILVTSLFACMNNWTCSASVWRWLQPAS